MNKLSNITVNGAPIEEYISGQVGAEIQIERASENKFKIRRQSISKHSRNVSGSKTSPGQVIYKRGQKETHIIVMGHVFPWELKAPYVRSGESTKGAIEYNADLDLVKCHECGEWRKSIGSHVRLHKLTSREYKRKHGIGRGRSISIPAISDRSRTLIKQRIKSGTARIFKDGHPLYGRAAGVTKGAQLSPELSNLKGRCKAQLEQKLRDLYAQLGRTPTANEIRENICKHLGTIQIAFGMKIKDVFKSLGMSTRRNTERTDSEDRRRRLLEEIVRHRHANHQWPNFSDIRSDKGMSHPTTYIRNFGSIGNAVALAQQWLDNRS